MQPSIDSTCERKCIGQQRRRRRRQPHQVLVLCCALLATALLLQLEGAAAFVPPAPAAPTPRRSFRPLQALPSSDSNEPEQQQPPSLASRRQALGQTSALGALLLLAGATTPEGARADGLEVQGYVDQLRQAMPVKTIRGVWRIREYRDGNTLCKGRLKMKGFVEEPNKGTLEYVGCNDGKGKGNWLLKPARIADGQIRFSARWKVRFADGDALIYRGDVLAGDGFSKATAQITRGEILKPVTGITGNLTERKIGTFEADLIEPSDDEEKL